MAMAGGHPAKKARAIVGAMVARVTNITIVTLTNTATKRKHIVTTTGILTATMVLSMVILTMIGVGPVATATGMDHGHKHKNN
jgi:hypothetical protein